MNVFQRLRAWYQHKTTAPFVPDGMVHLCLPTPGGQPFVHGVEVLNDDATPMLFVLQALQEDAQLSHGDAAVAVALCHEKGGVLIPMASRADAAATAERIAARARRASWPLACRAVSAPAAV